MNELNYQSMKTASQAREADEIRIDNRKKNLLILVLHYLMDKGYVESANVLSRETNIDVAKYDVCDNVDLETVLMEYESYYYVKFSRYPRLTKKPAQYVPSDHRTRSSKFQRSQSQVSSSISSRCNSTPSLPRILPNQQNSPLTEKAQNMNGPVSHGSRPRSANSPNKKIQTHSSPQHPTGQQSAQNDTVIDETKLGIQGLSVKSKPDPVIETRPRPGQIIDYRQMLNDATKLSPEEIDNLKEDRLLKPLGAYTGYNAEWRDLAQIISRDIFSNNPNVRWNDIIGLEKPKRLIKESVVYPIKYPQLFSGILSPWKGLLLYGPPGTGKTLLAKAVATECKTTFFNISASSIVSKWRGDSEKLVRILFELARFHAPSTIFLDELESLMSQRGGLSGGSNEHEGSLRMKTELLVQMDGLAKTDDLVFLLAASNIPWELDHAMLRRLEKRILVNLPTLEARSAMIEHHLPSETNIDENNHNNVSLQLRSDLDYGLLARETEGYSGSDLKLVCKEAAMRPVRKIFDILENHDEGENLDIILDIVTTEDVLEALKHTKPSARTLQHKYLEWQREYESV